MVEFEVALSRADIEFLGTANAAPPDRAEIERGLSRLVGIALGNLADQLLLPAPPPLETVS